MAEPQQFKPLAKNIAAVTISHFLLKLVSATISIVIARYLGVRELGYYATALGFASMIGLLTNTGLRDLLIKNISTKEEKINEYITSAIFIQFSIIIFVYLILLFLTNLLNYEPEVLLIIYSVGGFAFLSDFIEFLFAYYYGKQKMENIVFFRFLYSFSIISLIALLVYLKKDLVSITLANLSVAIGITVLLFISIIKDTDFKINRALFIPILRESFPFGLNIIYNIAYSRSGIVLLSFYAGAEQVGLFDSSYKVITMLGIVPNIVLTALYPMLFKLGAGSDNDYRQTFYPALKYLCFIGFPTSIFISIYAPEICTLIYGNKFAEAGAILRILAFIFSCQCLSLPLSDLLTTKNKQPVRTRISASAFIITLAGNLVFIPLAGVTGTAIVALLAELYLVFVLTYFGRSYFLGASIWDLACKQLISAIIMGVGLFYLYTKLTTNIIAGIFCSLIIYFFCLYLLNFDLLIKPFKLFASNKSDN